MTVWFSSDTHFYHANILQYCPWRKTWAQDVDHMHLTLITAWNEVVQPDDIVYHLGDFAFGSEEIITALRNVLNGKIFLALGNHDRTASSMRRCGFVVEHHFRVEYDGQIICMTHDPTRFRDDEIAEASMLLHGHRHGDDHHPSPDAAKDKLLDVGVDAIRRTRPISLEEVRALFHEKHHA